MVGIVTSAYTLAPAFAVAQAAPTAANIGIAAAKTAAAAGGVLGGPAAASGVGIVAQLTTAPTFAAMGPFGLLVLGASPTPDTKYSFDCWKPVLRNTSPVPSAGRLVADVLRDEAVVGWKMIGSQQMLVQNRWDDQFLINAVELTDGTLAAHATAI